MVGRRCSDSAREWFFCVYSGLEAPFNTNLFTVAYSGTRRRLGKSVVLLDSQEESILENKGITILKNSTLEEIGRATLLLRATECLPPEAHITFVDEVYRLGDNYERKALLRALSSLPDPDRFLSTAVEACRTNVSTVFEAITCDNPYPFHYFPDLHFNQMVLKALFIGTSLARVVGLSQRITADLIYMAKDFANERRAAGRVVPEDVALITIAKESQHESV